MNRFDIWFRGLGLAILVVFAFVVFTLVMITTAYAMLIAHAMARRKGYHSVGAKLIVGVGVLSWIVVFVAAMSGPPILALLLAYLSPMVAPIITVGLVRTLPRRRVRNLDRRRSGRQLVLAGWIMGIAGALAIAILFLFIAWPITSTTDAVVWLALVILECGVWCIPARMMIVTGRKAQRQATVEVGGGLDPRPPVLYVRPFDSERLPFLLGESSRYARFYGGFGQSADQNRGAPIMIPLENYLSEPLRRTVGPFVALGSPEDLIPPEGGALRMYSTDEGWQRKFDQLARSSAAIVLEVRESANLTWELEHIRRYGLQQRLIVLTEHPTWRRLKSARLWTWLESVMGFSRPSWSAFATALEALGYEMGAVDPGPGSIVSFDANGRGVVLTTAADEPMDYADAIRAHVARPV